MRSPNHIWKWRAATLGVVAALGLAPGAAAGAQSVGALRARLTTQRALQSRLTASVRSLSRVIDRLDGQVALVRRRERGVAEQLTVARAQLSRVRVDRGREQHDAAMLGRRLQRTRVALAAELLSGYESDPPDMVSLVLESHSFGDLLQRLDFLRIAKDRQTAVIRQTRTAKAAADGASRRLAALERRHARITAAAAAQARAIAAMDGLLGGRVAALRAARAARAAALHGSRRLSTRLKRQLDRLASRGFGALGGPGGWAIPYAIVLCESGGQNLPPNGAGASGYYQIIPSTWKSAGGRGPAAYLAPRADQDRVAAKLWDGGRGASNWVCAGLVRA